MITILIILVVNIYTTGFIKSISILIGLIVGTAIAASMGLVDFTPVDQAPILHVPTPFFFGAPKFEITSIVMMCIIATVSMVESTGVYLALSDITKDPIDSTRLRNGYRAEGLAVLLGGIFNTFPYTGFSQNVGLVKLSGIKTRLPIYYAAGFLVLLGLLPKFGALAQSFQVQYLVEPCWLCLVLYLFRGCRFWLVSISNTMSTTSSSRLYR